MRAILVTLVLCACTLAIVADIAHVKATKAKIISQLLNKGRHHKRGVLSPIPSYKLGHDIPHVTHSLVKPYVVTYPPTATVAAVKIPLSPPHTPHYPLHIGHKERLPHPHYGFKYPHTNFISKPDQHFHHHHHHIPPTPVVPVVPAPAPIVPVAPTVHAAPVAPVLPLGPVGQPTATFAQPVPAPWALPTPLLPRNPLPLAAPPLQLLSPQLKPLLPAATVAIPPSTVLPAPVLPYSQRIPYVIRPGNAVQTSFFATYPRYPFLNSYQAPIFPLPAANAVSSVQQVVYERPPVPQFHLYQQSAAAPGIIEQHTPNIAVDQTPAIIHSQLAPQPELHVHSATQPEFHLHPTQVAHQPEFHIHPSQLAPQPELHIHPSQLAPQPEFHIQPTQETLPSPPLHLHPNQEIPQPALHLQPTHSTIPLDNNGWSPVPAHPLDTGATQHEAHYPQQTHHFTQEQGTQVYEHHTDNQYPDLHQLQHHIQQQIEQAQYEQSLNNQHHLQQEYGTPQQEYGQPNEYSQQGQDFHQQGQDFSQHVHDFHQQSDGSLQGQNFAQNDYDLGHGQEYGLPQQGVEGRSEDSDQQFHNHIPLALQPPLDRPLDHFH